MPSLRPLLLAALALFFAPIAPAQITNVTGQTATPIPGAGHDYIHMLNETVDLSGGTVNVHISVPMPPGRKFTLPFGFAYSSTGAFVLQPDPDNAGMDPIASPNIGPMILGGWSYALPQLSRITTTYNAGWQGDSSSICSATTGYVFTDPAGTRHNLELSHIYNEYTGRGAETAACVKSGYHEYETGGDATIRAALLPPFNNDTLGNTTPYDGTPEVTDAAGTSYYFPWPLQQCHPTDWSTNYGLPSTVSDRNGNGVSISTNSQCTTFSVTDSISRTALSGSNFPLGGTTPQTSIVTVAGLSQPYSLYWSYVSPTGSIPISSSQIYAVPDDTCAAMPGGASTLGLAVTSITLPNDQQYQFTYDSQSGFLTKITYPSGGYVSYSWGASPHAAVITFNDIYGNANCSYVYDTPAVVHRYVSFDGQTVALQQDFSYTTTWNPNNLLYWTSKTTTVTTHDLIRGTQFTTVYTWSPSGVSPAPNLKVGFGQIALESKITYSDTGGTLLKTVQKGWTNSNPFELNCELVQMSGSGPVAGAFYTYGPGAQITDNREYDYGQVGSLTACSNTASPPGGVTPARETATTYQSGFPTPTGFIGPVILDRPCEVVTKDKTGSPAAETDYYYDSGSTLCGGSPTVGNATKIVKRCLQGCTTDSVSMFAYDSHGQITSTTDPCGNTSCSDMTGSNHTTTYSYTDSYSSCGGNAPPISPSDAYLTQVTDPLSHTVSYCYDYTTGLLRSSTDENNQTTSYKYNDLLARLTETDYPCADSICGQTLISYNDAPPNPSVTTNRLIGSGVYLTTIETANGLGAPIETRITSDPDCASGDRTDTTYDGLGRAYTVSNPYCSTSDPTYGITTYTYDALGRTCFVEPPGGTSGSGSCPTTPVAGDISTIYSRRAAETVDESGKARISQVDGLGRLTSVCEVTSTTLSVGIGGSTTPSSCGLDISGTGFLTTYGYDVLGDLTSVIQGPLNPRSFSYNSLGELLTANNPESGQTTYTYDANGNLATKVAPLPNQTGSATVTTTYSYDALNRLTQKSYSDGTTPTVQFGYDTQNVTIGTTNAQATNYIGRLSWETTLGSVTKSVFSYDPLGRINEIWSCQNVSCSAPILYSIYSYDGIGDEVSRSIDSEPFSETYNGAGRLTSFTQTDYSDSTNPGTLLSGATYDAFGHIVSANLGNGLSESRRYDNRGRLSSGAVGTGCGGGSCTNAKYSTSVAYYANGDVMSANDTANGNWVYTYDDFNRLVSSVGGPNGYTYTYDYDRFGNRWNQKLNGGCTAGTAACVSFDANNHMTNLVQTYDAAGNVRSDSAHSYAYDAENRLVSLDGSATTYLYDAEGRRLERRTNGTATRDWYYNRDGTTLIEIAPPYPLYQELYAAGMHIATRTLNAAHNGTDTYFHHADWLGTERARTDWAGNLCETVASLPFGDGETPTTTCPEGDVSPMHFTGKERDLESGLDYFGARYNSSTFGRFMTPDWAAKPTAVPYAEFGNPQSLNLYIYVKNNPLTTRDPDGHCCSDEASFLGQELIGVGEALVNTVTSNLNTVTSIHGAVFVPNSGTNIPEIEPRNLGQEVGNAVASAALVVAPFAEEGEASRDAVVLENYAKGRAYQDAVAAKQALTDSDVVQNVTLKTQTGVRTQMDIVSTDPHGNVVLTEAKSSSTAPLTKNQALAHPEIEKTGATVVGQGKPPYSGGTEIPPTKVRVVRPGGTPE